MSFFQISPSFAEVVRSQRVPDHRCISLSSVAVHCSRSSSAAVRCSRSSFAAVRCSKSSSAAVHCSRLVFITIFAAAVHRRKRHREDLRCSRVSLLYSRGSNAAKTSATAVKTSVFCREDYTVKVPTQLQGWECGYYVMKFMREVITQQELIIPENVLVLPTFFRNLQAICHLPQEA
ncbi:uncharacterized protein LOC129308282 [Prosopis cineraria]|uniref:uncharacterized protein LOC129308282 n=1 Tax=Prosopis cineraria TaxID=364024 RepID=UPI00240EC295|nr:uncharacterized protein LOC129308282 [Prosopis cineraria]